MAIMTKSGGISDAWVTINNGAGKVKRPVTMGLCDAFYVYETETGLMTLTPFI